MKASRNIDAGQKALAAFNTAAALMTAIPLLICCYLIAAKFYSIWILVGANGVYFLAAVVTAVTGLLIGRRLITRIVQQLVEANATAERLVGELKTTNARLVRELALRYEAEEEVRNTQELLIHAEKIGAVGQLASGVAHEVKNPLAIILQAANYLEQDDTLRTPKQLEFLAMIKESVTRADKIVRALLNFSRREKLRLQPDQFNPIVDGALELAERQMHLRNVTTAKELAPALPPVRVSADHMKQVLINLILNALQAMPRGGQLTIRTLTTRLSGAATLVSRRMTDPLRPGDPVVICEVSDSGCGIPRERIARLFDPFYTTKPIGKGTGLGLSLSYGIVQKHNGNIEVQTEIGKGTTFRVTLPLLQPQTPESGDRL